MGIPVVQKVQIAVLCELAKPPEDRRLNFDLIRRAILQEDLWVFDRSFNMFELDVGVPKRVKFVRDVLDMWYRLERLYSDLDGPEKSRVIAETYMPDGLVFPGFFQSQRSRERFRIAQIIVEDIGFFPDFKGRVNGPYLIRGYDRMLAAWRSLRGEFERRSRRDRMRAGPSADDIIAVARERIAPRYRIAGAGGLWTPSDEWDECHGFFIEHEGRCVRPPSMADGRG